MGTRYAGGTISNGDKVRKGVAGPKQVGRLRLDVAIPVAFFFSADEAALAPIVNTDLFRILMTHNVSLCLDSICSDAFTALLAQTYVHLLSRPKDVWRDQLIHRYPAFVPLQGCKAVHTRGCEQDQLVSRSQIAFEEGSRGFQPDHATAHNMAARQKPRGAFTAAEDKVVLETQRTAIQYLEMETAANSGGCEMGRKTVQALLQHIHTSMNPATPRNQNLSHPHRIVGPWTSPKSGWVGIDWNSPLPAPPPPPFRSTTLVRVPKIQKLIYPSPVAAGGGGGYGEPDMSSGLQVMRMTKVPMTEVPVARPPPPRAMEMFWKKKPLTGTSKNDQVLTVEPPPPSPPNLLQQPLPSLPPSNKRPTPPPQIGWWAPHEESNHRAWIVLGKMLPPRRRALGQKPSAPTTSAWGLRTKTRAME